jgi:hypothetical protein
VAGEEKIGGKRLSFPGLAAAASRGEVMGERE